MRESLTGWIKLWKRVPERMLACYAVWQFAHLRLANGRAVALPTSMSASRKSKVAILIHASNQIKMQYSHR